MTDVTILRRPSDHEVCILVAGTRRGIFFPADVLEWLQDEAVTWTVRGNVEKISFTIPDNTERMLFMIRFAHLRE